MNSNFNFKIRVKIFQKDALFHSSSSQKLCDCMCTQSRQNYVLFESVLLLFILLVLGQFYVKIIAHKEPYIKHVGRRGRWGGWVRSLFKGVMKYFRHILMGHEIFFKTFDGPQNVFLCFIFVILIFKLRVLEYKISKLAIKEI